MKTDKKEIEFWLKEMGVKEYCISNEGIVDALDVNLSHKNLLFIPVQFGKVEISFNVSYNQLLTLRGSPSEVDRFWCDNNSLATLAGAPNTVHNTFDCRFNKPLHSLKHCPKKAKNLFFENTSISSLEFFDCEFEQFSHSKLCGYTIEELKECYDGLYLHINFDTYKSIIEKQQFEHIIMDVNHHFKKLKI